jgi:hypothetical protein
MSLCGESMRCAAVGDRVFEKQMIFKHFTARKSLPKKLVIQVAEIAGFGRVFQTGGFGWDSEQLTYLRGDEAWVSTTGSFENLAGESGGSAIQWAAARYLNLAIRHQRSSLRNC